MEKEKAKIEEKKVKQNGGKSEKRIITFLIILIVVLAIIVLALVFKTQLNTLWHNIKGDTFKYHNITFQKTKFGNLTMYATQLAIYRPTENKTYGYTLYLRNDPRELETIQANISSKLQRKVYVSFEAQPLECNGSILAAYKLGEFIDALGLYKEGTFANEEIANNSGYNSDKVKNCSDAKRGQSVVLFKQSDKSESYIHQEDYCYILEVANCEIIETSERFILALIDTMSKKQEEENKTEINTTNSS